MAQVTIEGAETLDEVITALERELRETLKRAVQFERRRSKAITKRGAQAFLAEYELEHSSQEVS